MLIWFTDGVSGKTVAVNPELVAAVFTAMDPPEISGKTVISLTNGSVIVTETDIEVVGKLNGELNK